MLFTEQFRISKDSTDSWFDPLLTHDTRLFIDPFQIFQTKHPQFSHGHDKIIQFFNHVFGLIAKSGGNKASIFYHQALALLMFPEVDEICLGFAQNTTKGLGSGQEYSRLIADAIWNSIESGVNQLSHFEELSIFNEGIGADRISDMTANLFKAELIVYTQEICRKYNIPMQTRMVRNTSYSLVTNRWSSSRVALPYNPITNKPIILVPEEFLSALPAINHDDFLDYVYSFENNLLRETFSHYVKSKITKADIVELARKHIPTVERYVKRKERVGAKPYNLQSDKQGLYRWYSIGKDFVQENPLTLTPPKNQQEFLDRIHEIVNVFKHFVEHEKGYLLLHDQMGTPMSEKAVQRLFWGITIHYCRSNGIDCSAEVDSGSGPVDFKFSNGYQMRLLLEIKLANHTRLWNGLRTQLPQYLETEKINDGIFMIVAYNRKDLVRVNSKILKELAAVVQQTGKNITQIVIDASRKISASKL